MSRKVVCLAASLCFVVGPIHSAVAADLPVKAPPVPAAVAALRLGTQGMVGPIRDSARNWLAPRNRMVGWYPGRRGLSNR